MKAVNLIPLDARGRRTSSAGARSGLGAYLVLAALVVVVLMGSAVAYTGRQVSDRKADLARAEQQARDAEATAATLVPYTTFATLSRARVQTLDGLIAGRFNWSLGLREVARVVPRDVDLISLAGSGGSLRAALPVPAIDLVGCAKSQSRVASLLARLRAIDGVQRVTISSSEKSENGSPSDSDCRATSQMPQFQLTVFFQAQHGIVPAADATAATAATTATTPGGAG
jgi:Tfp pilus assembly protein PilN